MPFHSTHHHHQGSQSAQHTPAGAIYQAAQALGSIGAPTGNLRVATTGTTSAGTDALLPDSGNASGLQSAGGHSAPSTASGLPGSFDQAHHRAPTLGRMPEELHISTSTAVMGQQGSTQGAMSATPQQQQQQQQSHYHHQPQQQPLHQHHQQQQMYHSPDQYSAGAAPAVNLHQTTSQAGQFADTSSSAALPGSLQPGGTSQHQQQRPGPSSAYTAPSTVPTMPQLNTNAQQYTLPTRTSTMTQQQQHSSSHNYSRSSPAGLGPDQKYIPFSNTPENSQKYLAGTPAQKYYPTTPSGAASNSPLGLADIRPRANSSLNEDGMGAATFFNDGDRAPSNSNYLAPWGVYAFDWCKWHVNGGNSAGKMAVGSYLEDTHNFIQILDTHITPQDVSAPGSTPYGLEYTRIAEATCSYPVTRILWEPPASNKQSTDLLATSGDHLRLWSLPPPSGSTASNTITRSSSVNTREPPPQKLTPLALLSNSKTPEHTAPLTSLDWNTMSPKLIITSSIDTTCTIWDIPTLTAKTQLIAHDKEVFDVRFCAGSVDVFVSCGADGSVRMFDLRSLEHSTIIYEPSEKLISDRDRSSPSGRMSPTKAQQTMSYAPPLLRLAASPHDSHLLATFAADSSLIRVLDVRQPGQALLELRGHSAAVNSIEWNPSRRGMLASGADDHLVLIWDLLHAENSATISESTPGGAQASTPRSAHPTNGSQRSEQVSQKGPYASWKCDYEVGNISWAPQSVLTSQGGEWVGVAGGRGIWGVKL